ncbi:PspC domain-containing protein [Arcticibacter svalbardensis]|nr:PspC domain-containing protein [Arcticibacter svalbardensis]
MEKKLQRDENNKVLAGVAAGLAEYFEIEVMWIRLIFILMIVLGLSGVLIYLILWIVVPAKPCTFPFDSDAKINGDYSANPGSFRTFGDMGKRSKNAPIAGLILVALGVYFLFEEFGFVPDWFELRKLWPVILIIIGLVFLFRSGKKQKVEEVKKEEFKFNEPTDDQPLT